MSFFRLHLKPLNSCVWIILWNWFETSAVLSLNPNLSKLWQTQAHTHTPLQCPQFCRSLWEAPMQHVDLKSIDLSPCVASLPLLSLGVCWRGLFAGTHSLCSSICYSVRRWLDEGFKVDAGSLILSESPGWCKCLMALVIRLLWRVLWWMVMQCFLMVPELHRRVCRLFGLGV